MKKGILAALALSLALPACALGEAGYTAGTYSAEAQGMESAVKVTVTVSDSAITDLTIDVSGETAGLGAGTILVAARFFVSVMPRQPPSSAPSYAG